MSNANKLADPPSDDRNLVGLWSSLAYEYGIELIVCVAAAMRRGINDDLLAKGFKISGLGQLVEAGILGDKLVTFGE